MGGELSAVRPVRIDGQPYDQRVALYLTRQQREALDAYAESQGVRRGEYLRLLVTDDVPREFYRPLDPPPGQMRLGE